MKQHTALRQRYVELLPQLAQMAQHARMQTLDEVYATGRVDEVADLLALDTESAAWLLGVTNGLRFTHPSLLSDWTRPGTFFYVWAGLAPISRPVPHINQVRFERWLDAAMDPDSMDQWYQYTLEALRVLRGKMFDVRSLYDIAAFDRCSGPSFARWSAAEFARHQPAGIRKSQPPYQPSAGPDDEPMGRVQFGVPMRSKTAWVKAAHRDGMKLEPWIIQKLDDAAEG